MDQEIKEVFVRAENLLLFGIDPNGNDQGKASTTEALLCQDIAHLRKYVESHERVIEYCDEVGRQLSAATNELAFMQGNNKTENEANKQHGRIETLKIVQEELKLLTGDSSSAPS